MAIRGRAAGGSRLFLADVGTGVMRDVLVIPDRYPNALAHVPSGGWVWVRSGRPEIRVQLPADASPRRIPLPAWYGLTSQVDVSRDGRFLAIAGSKALSSDSIRVSVLSFADSAVTPWLTAFGRIGDMGWLNDGTLLVVFQDAQETYSLYHLLGPGRVEKLGTIPRRVSSVSVSKDLKRTAVVVRDHRGDAWMSAVVRR